MPSNKFQPIKQVTRNSSLALITSFALVACNGGPTPVSSSSATSVAELSSSSIIASSSAVSSSSSIMSSSSISSAESSSMPPSSSSTASSVTASNSCADQTNLYVCLDFEDVAPGAIPSGFNKDGANAEVVQDTAFNGDHSAKFKAAGASYQGFNNYGRFVTASEIPATHWGRLYYKMKTPVPNNQSYFHITMVDAKPNDGMNSQYRFLDTVQRKSDGTFHYLYNYDNSSNVDTGLNGPYNETFSAEWTCIEWHADAQNQTFNLYKDSSEIILKLGNDYASAPVSNKTNNAGFTPLPSNLQLGFGLQYWQSGESAAVEMWMDDIAVGPERIGCGNVMSPSSSSSAVSSSSVSNSSSPSNTPAGVLFEDNFESYSANTLPTGPWAPVNTSELARVSISGTDAYSGSKSARISSSGAFNPSFMVLTLPAAAASADHLYFRMYVNASAGLGGDGGHGHLIELGDPGGQEVIRYGEANGSIGVNTLAGGDPLSPKPNSSDNDMPAGGWHCLEVLFDKRPEYDELTTWVDGTVMHKVSINNGAWGDQWTNNGPAKNWLENAFKYTARFGWYAFNGVRGNTIFFDDIVIATEPVGCGYIPN